MSALDIKDDGGRFSYPDATYLYSREPLQLVRARHGEAITHRFRGIGSVTVQAVASGNFLDFDPKTEILDEGLLLHRQRASLGQWHGGGLARLGRYSSD